MSVSTGYIWDEWSDSDEDKGINRPPSHRSKESLPYPPAKSKPSTASTSSLKLEHARSNHPPRPQSEGLHNPSSKSTHLLDFPAPPRGDSSVISKRSERSSKTSAANLEKELEIYANDDFSSIGFESLPRSHPISNNSHSHSHINHNSHLSSAPLSGLTASPSVAFASHRSEAPSYAELMKEDSPSTVTSATTVLSELKLKLARIQSNITEISTKNRALKTELVRLQTSKERKVNKLTANYEGKVQQLSTDHQAALNQLATFQSKVLADIKALKQKYTDLERKVQEVQLKKTSLLPTLQQEQQRKKAKFLKGLETDELAFFEKQFTAKYESSYKEKQTVEHFTPKLQEWMAAHKEEVAQRRQDLDHQLETKRLSLQQTQASHLLEYKQQLLSEKDAELEKVRQQEERQWKEFIDKHEKELQQLQESYCETEKRKIMANYDLTQQNEFSFHQKTLETIMAKENSLLSELLESQKQEMNSLVSQKAALFQQYSLELAAEKESFLKSLSHQHEQQEIAALETLQRKVNNYFVLSTQEILLKLSSEYSQKRDQLQQQYDSQIQQARDKSETRLQQLKDSEEKSLSRMVSLRGEVEALEEELKQLGGDPKYYLQKIDQQRDKLSGLREELHQKEKQSESLDESLSEEKKKEEKRLQIEVETLQSELDHQRRLKLDQESQQLSEQQRIEAEYESELARIRQKIDLVLEKKDKTIAQCRLELQDLQRLNRESEIQLEELRKKSLLG